MLSLCAGAAPPSCSNPWRVAGDAVRWEVHSSAEEGKPWRRIVSGSPRVTSLQPCGDYSFGWQVHSLCNTECHLLRYLVILQRDTLIICLLYCRWRPETHTFHLPCGEMTVTLQDVQKSLASKLEAVQLQDSAGPMVGRIGWRDSSRLSFLKQDLELGPQECLSVGFGNISATVRQMPMCRQFRGTVERGYHTCSGVFFSQMQSVRCTISFQLLLLQLQL